MAARPGDTRTPHDLACVSRFLRTTLPSPSSASSLVFRVSFAFYRSPITIQLFCPCMDAHVLFYCCCSRGRALARPFSLTGRRCPLAGQLTSCTALLSRLTLLTRCTAATTVLSLLSFVRSRCSASLTGCRHSNPSVVAVPVDSCCFAHLFCPPHFSCV